MSAARSVIFNLVGRDNASKAFATASKAADAAATRVDRSALRMQAAGARMQAAGAKLSKAVTLPVLAFVAYGAKQATEFEKQMTLLRTAAGESEANMRVITSGIKTVSSDTATSLHDLGEGMYVIAKAAKSRGWTGAEQLNILKAAAQGAKAEQVDLTVATDALSTVMTDYHSKASDAVKVENQLVVASGLAKTNFGLFSESLSNVTPIAAALHLSFAEVGGAIATMTQHGVTAQRATENLRNLLFNLAGQNNVASQAMQQLGINTVDLSQNLGRRGLTGTLAIVDKALKDHTRNGKVTVDIHRAAALATQSLGTMIGDMSGKLRGQSKELLTGKTGILDYTKYAKSLGGTAGASALQFLSLYKNSLGFSNQLKSGKGTVTTSVQQYQKMLGGMTGASVAMQIAGKYAGDNAKNVKHVADAAKEAGTNVHGWEKTQQTLSYKLKDASNKASLLATTVGQKVIPFLGQLADGAAKAFHWFDQLGSGTKKFIGIALLIGATLGPVLALVGRLTRGFAILFSAGIGASRLIAGIRGVELSLGAMQTRQYGAGMAIRNSFLNMGTAAKGATAAISGIAIGASIGMLTRNASGASKAVGALASAGVGAAAGFAMTGSPFGAAIGGATGLLSNLAANFLGAGDAAKKSVKPTDEYTQAILRDNDALGQNTRGLVANKLQKAGAYDAGLKLGISVRTLTDAAMGNKAAMQQVATAQKATALASAAGNKNAEAYIKANHKLNDVLGNVSETLKVNKHAADQYREATSLAGKTQSAQVKELKRIKTVQDEASSSLKNLNVLVGTHGASLDASTKQGAANASVLTKTITANNAVAKAQFNAGTSMASVQKQAKANTTALVEHATAAGFDAKAVNALVAKYNLTPKQIVTNMVANIDKGTASAGQLQRVLDSVKQNKVPGLKADSTQGRAVIAAIQARINSLSQGKPVPLKAQAAQLAATARAAQQFIDRIRQGKVPGIKANSAEARLMIARLQTIIDNTKQKAPISVAVNDRATPVLDGITTELNRLRDKTVNVTVQRRSGAAVSRQVGGGQKAEANGGVLSFFAEGAVRRERHVAQLAPAGAMRLWAEPETGGEAYIPLAASKRTRSRAIAAETVRLLGGVAAFATGGITHKGKDWIYGGTKYASKRAAENAQSRAKKTSSADRGQQVSNAISAIGQVSSSPIDLSSLGITRVQAQIAHAQAVLDAQIRQGLSKKAAASARSQLANLRRDANNQLNGLRVKIKGSDMSAIKSAFGGTADDLRGAFSTLLTDVSRAGGSARVVNNLRATERTMLTKQAARARVLNQLTAAQDKYNAAVEQYNDLQSQVKSAFTGSFDITSAGTSNVVGGGVPVAGLAGVSVATGSGSSVSANSILAEITKAADNAAAYSTLLQKLGRAGLNKDLLQQLALAGPQAMDQAKALAAATPATLTAINSKYTSIVSSGSTAGKFLADSMYGSGVAAAKGLVDGLNSQASTLNAAMTKLAGSMVATLKKELKIKSPSRVMHALGSFTVEGYRRGMVSRLGGVDQASRDLANAATPQSQLDAWGASRRPGADGPPVQVVVNPRAEQSETEIGKVAANEVLWALRR